MTNVAGKTYAELNMALPSGEIAPPMAAKSYVNLSSEPQNISANATVARVQAAIRAAEGGNTRDLFALYRDEVLTGSHVQAEFAKRKLAILAEPLSVLPKNKDNPEDVKAANAVAQAIEDCENFSAGVTHLLDSCLWPLAIVEAIYQPVNGSEALKRGEEVRDSKVPQLKFSLKTLAIVNHALECYEQDQSWGATSEGAQPVEIWEPEVRLWRTDASGDILWSREDAYHLERGRHILHRGHLLVGIKDCFGGPMRAILFWWLLSTLGRDWFGRYMERFGAPWPVAKTDAQNADAVSFLKNALSLSTKVGGIVVDHETEIELAEAMTSGGADAYDKFISVCNREVSKVIVGQTTSAEAQSTGLGSGIAKFQSEVRDDWKRFDRQALAQTLTQLFCKPFLKWNGLVGSPPLLVWGTIAPDQVKALGALLVDLKNANLEPTDDAIPAIGEKVGFELQRAMQPATAPGGAGFGGVPFTALNAGGLRLGNPVSDQVAREKAKALTAAFRGALAPVRKIVMDSESPEELIRSLSAYFPDWKPGKVAAVAEEALQVCAAAGAAAQTDQRPGTKD